MSATTNAIEVIDRQSGELVDLRAASEDRLAELMTTSAEMRGELAETESMISAELLRRLDKSGSWTHRVGDPARGIQYEIKAPSPTAGTTAYEAAAMRAELQQLITRDTIAVEAADAALERTIVLAAKAPLDADLQRVERELRGATVEIAGVSCTVTSASVGENVKLAGVKALLKIPGTKAAVDRATVNLPAPSRKAKVKPILKSAA